MSHHRKAADVRGDSIEIYWDGSMWVSPSNGVQHGRAEHAMRAELRRYFADCGEDVEDQAVADEIEGCVSRMADVD